MRLAHCAIQAGPGPEWAGPGRCGESVGTSQPEAVPHFAHAVQYVHVRDVRGAPRLSLIVSPAVSESGCGVKMSKSQWAVSCRSALLQHGSNAPK